jgi:hypothetical protein
VDAESLKGRDGGSVVTLLTPSVDSLDRPLDTKLGAKVASPLYVGLKVCLPALRVAVENTDSSLPPTFWSATGGWVVPSIVKLTAPVGVPS